MRGMLMSIRTTSGRQQLCLLNGLDPSPASPQMCQLCLVLDEAAQRTAKQFVVVGDQDFDGIPFAAPGGIGISMRGLKILRRQKRLCNAGKVGSSTVFHR